MAQKDVKLPEIGEGVTEGELVKWLVKIGDSVAPDQPIAEVMTDKATVEVPSPVAGQVLDLKFKEGDVISVESTMLVLETGGAQPEAQAKDSAPEPRPTPEPPKSAPSSSPSVSAKGSMDVVPPAADVHVLATPATRRLAREMNVDINQIQGTGLAGRVTREDVLKHQTGTGAVAAGQPVIARSSIVSAGPQEERVPLRGIRRKIAETMQNTKRVVPHFTTMDEANVTELVRLRSQAKKTAEDQGVKVTYLPFVMKALVSTLREFPMFNASIDDEAQEIVYKKHYNIGFAADTPNGLLVPVIKNADMKTILQISQEIQGLAKKARDGKISAEEMKGATITITNIGSVGGTYATPIINHPEVAIIGMYKIDWKPVYKDGEFVPTQVMNFSATCDHRLIDGAVAANFLKAFLRRLENVGQLVLDMI